MKKLLSVVIVMVLVLSLCACSGNNKSYNLGGADRARAFYETYSKYVSEYGEAKADNGTLHGAAVVRLYDFTGDSTPEMLIAYSSEKNGKVDSVMVFGFDMGLAEIYNEKITSKASKDAADASLWVYTDSSGLSYLVLGDDMSASRSYTTYKIADSEGKPLYAFVEAFETDGNDLGGVYEKFDVSGADFEAISAENKNVLDAMESQKN